MNIFLSILLNLADFALLYYLMPDVSVVIFLIFSLLTPIIYNVILSLKTKDNTSNWLVMIIFSGITALAYSAFAYALSMSGNLTGFIEYNTMNSGSLVVNIDENITALSHIMFIMLVQFCTLFIVKTIIARRNNNDQRK